MRICRCKVGCNDAGGRKIMPRGEPSFGDEVSRKKSDYSEGGVLRRSPAAVRIGSIWKRKTVKRGTVELSLRRGDRKAQKVVGIR